MLEDFQLTHCSNIKAYGKIIKNVSKFNGTIGMENVGKPPLTDAKSSTRGTGISKRITIVALIQLQLMELVLLELFWV
uniref:Uncharacterized protein n=1 Tax=uncultured alpha proteobacterium EB080_L43F08 TaxID=710797 RepID=E0Y1A2_9PROT|nr:hypothetical protein [uncultured alpha proteobacterium EB080_L43F08]